MGAGRLNQSMMQLVSTVIPLLIVPRPLQRSFSLSVSLTSRFCDGTHVEYARLVTRRIMTSVVPGHFLGQQEVARDCYSITISLQ